MINLHWERYIDDHNNISLFWNPLSFIKIEMRNIENVQELHCVWNKRSDVDITLKAHVEMSCLTFEKAIPLKKLTDSLHLDLQ